VDKWTVIGVYAEPLGQRYAEVIIAASAEEAEAKAIEQADSDLIVAGVVKGEVALADVAYADDFEPSPDPNWMNP
jgi:predicted dinucleotide-binding enzyme